MGYMKFTMSHPFLFLSIFLFVILFPIILLFTYYEFGLSFNISLSASFLSSIGFILLIIIPTVFKQGKKGFNKFIKNLGNIVIVSKPFLNSIETKDFPNLKIIYFERIQKYTPRKRVDFYHTPHDRKLRRITTMADAELKKGSEFYKNSVEGKFSFAFNIPKSSVKIDVPEFNYEESKYHLNSDFKKWKNYYPFLENIHKNLPSWVDKLEIFYQDETVFVTLFAEREFCLNNSSKVYNKIVEIKNKLTD